MYQVVKACPFLGSAWARVRNFRKCSLSKYIPESSGLFTPIERPEEKRVCPCSLIRRASITVEAAIMVPLFFMAVICIASIMLVFSNTLERMVQLRDTCQQTAVLAGTMDEEYWVDITVPESFKPYFLPVNTTLVMCRGRARAWTGRSAEEAAAAAKEGSCSEYVYVTEYGNVYHTDAGCHYLDLSIKMVNGFQINYLRNAGGEKYYACECCCGEAAEGGTYYITSYGNRYHSSESCSALKRTVRMIDISQAEGMKECSKCASHT